MKLSKTVLISLVLLLTSGTLLAKPNLRQERVNLTLVVSSFDQAAEDLREVTAEYSVMIQNLNLNRESTSGNANLRVPPEQLAELVQNLSQLGEVENQSQSSNDFASSYINYRDRLDSYQALRSLKLEKSFQKLPAETREQARMEYKNWLKNQIQSAESSLRSYQEQASYAEVYLTFRVDKSVAQQEKQPNSQADPTTEEPGKKAPAPPQPHHGPAPEFFVLCLINLAGLWLIYRKVDSTPQVGVND